MRYAHTHRTLCHYRAWVMTRALIFMTFAILQVLSHKVSIDYSEIFVTAIVYLHIG
jgi:hypothetical protein